ncbi:MAG TPA: methylamine utilization protein MauJ [archaeon]|nr:methylamine utilization protein MauJ [archaeon]
MNPEEYKKEKGFWTIAHLEQDIGWPQEDRLEFYKGEMLLLLAPTSYLVEAIAVRKDFELGKLNKLEYDAQKVILNYISALAWVRDSKIKIIEWGGGSYPFRMQSSKHSSILTTFFSNHYLPEPTDEKARIALAFYREGLYLDHVPYKFLSFYKIINLIFNNGRQQKEWINSNAELLRKSDAKERVEEILSSKLDLGEYLFKSCRCAVAHAGVKPFVDPDNFEDYQRLFKDLSVIRELAKIIIEQRLGIKSQKTVWAEHLYELEGFRKFFGKNLLNSIKNAEVIAEGKIPSLPPLSIRLHGTKKFESFENIRVTIDKIAEGCVFLTFENDLSYLKITATLDFRNEKFVFDPFKSFKLLQNDTFISYKTELDLLGFLKSYFSNGQLEIWNNKENALWCYCDSFIPCNIDPSKLFEFFNCRIKICQEYMEKLK